MDNPFTPDWSQIETSSVWREQILPWLQSQRQDWLEMRAGILGIPSFQNEMPTTDEFHYWRGACMALKLICDMPSNMVDQNRIEGAQEKQDAFVGQRDADRRAARRSSF